MAHMVGTSSAGISRNIDIGGHKMSEKGICANQVNVAKGYLATPQAKVLVSRSDYLSFSAVGIVMHMGVKPLP
jgi:hypothetical protein